MIWAQGVAYSDLRHCPARKRVNSNTRHGIVDAYNLSNIRD
jgi:hypothetical protein